MDVSVPNKIGRKEAEKEEEAAPRPSAEAPQLRP